MPDGEATQPSEPVAGGRGSADGRDTGGTGSRAESAPESPKAGQDEEKTSGGCCGGGEEPPFSRSKYRQLERSCTDMPCCIPLAVLAALWVALGYFAFANGDPTRLLRGSDFNGNWCGKGAVQHLPLEFTPDPRYKQYTICVASCPVLHGELVRSINTAHQPPSNITAVNVYGRTYDDLGHCFPVDSAASAQHVLGAVNVSQAAAMAVATLSLGGSSTYSHEISQGFRELAYTWPVIAATAVLSVILYLLVILAMRWLATPLVYGSVLLLLLVLVGMGFFCKWNADDIREEECADRGRENPAFVHASTNRLSPTPSANSSVVWAGWGSSPAEMRPCLVSWAVTGWETMAYICWILAGVYFIFLVWLWSKLRIAVGVLKMAGSAVVSMPTSVCVPVVAWLLLSAVTVWMYVVAVYLHSSGSTSSVPPANQPLVANIVPSAAGASNGGGTAPTAAPTTSPSAAGAPSSNLTNTSASLWQWDSTLAHSQTANVFIFFWVFNFVSGCAYMSLAMMFSDWYFSANQPPDEKEVEKKGIGVTQGLYRVVRYHLGTVAMGSLLIAIINFIRYLFNRLYDNIRDGGMLMSVVACCVNCLLGCIERLVRYLSQMAYIITAIHSYSFCRSMGRILTVVMRNLGEVAVVSYVSDLVLVLVRVLAASCAVLLARALAYSALIVDPSKVSTMLVPCLLVFAIVYILGAPFVSVYGTAIDCLFVCYIEDVDAMRSAGDKVRYAAEELCVPLEMQAVLDDLPKSAPEPSDTK
eukprot:TRINITY_DN22114_c0_g1_i1.p1 TRINITY_DN22114_c0_g1~~TRINITY_DN22114_c0_g1_i1.p1  ORF type:complete len:757 (+),score=204.86 TRINITY_DN22114_c0_g1_i1:78-2348(+)